MWASRSENLSLRLFFGIHHFLFLSIYLSCVLCVWIIQVERIPQHNVQFSIHWIYFVNGIFHIMSHLPDAWNATFIVQWSFIVVLSAIKMMIQLLLLFKCWIDHPLCQINCYEKYWKFYKLNTCIQQHTEHKWDGKNIAFFKITE